MEQIKDRLKQLRHAVGIKQRELADRLEVQVGLIGNWESGARNIPKTRIYQICKEYNVRKEWLIDGEGEMFETSKKRSLRDHAIAMYEDLPDDAKCLVFDIAKAFVDTNGDVKKAAKIIDARIKDFVDEHRTNTEPRNVTFGGEHNTNTYIENQK